MAAVLVVIDVSPQQAYRCTSLIRNQNLRIQTRSGPLVFLSYYLRVDKVFRLVNPLVEI